MLSKERNRSIRYIVAICVFMTITETGTFVEILTNELLLKYLYGNHKSFI